MRILLALTLFLLSSCSGTRDCDVDQATNKMLALGQIQARLVARGGESGLKLSLSLAQETAEISTLIAAQQYPQACAKADEIAKRIGADLEAEKKNMLTIEQLQNDGGKGAGSCSMAEAAKKQMEVHALIQAEVDAGKLDSEKFRDFNDDLKPFAELLSSDPSQACALLEKLKNKYVPGR